jgi:hypothetical protein
MAALATVVDSMAMAREYALLGNYDASLVYFDAVLAQLQNHLRAVREPAHAARVRACKDELAAEMALVKELSAALKGFHEPAGQQQAPRAAALRRLPPDPFDNIVVKTAANRPAAAAEPENDPDVWGPPPARPQVARRVSSGFAGAADNSHIPAWARREEANQHAHNANNAQPGARVASAVGRPRLARPAGGAPSGVAARGGAGGGGVNYGNVGNCGNAPERGARKPALPRRGGERGGGGGGNDGHGGRPRFEPVGADIELAAMVERDIVDTNPRCARRIVSPGRATAACGAGRGARLLRLAACVRVLCARARVRACVRHA